MEQEKKDEEGNFIGTVLEKLIRVEILCRGLSNILRRTNDSEEGLTSESERALAVILEDICEVVCNVREDIDRRAVDGTLAY